MSDSTQAILDAALALPDGERSVLVERLLESLPCEEAEVSEEEFFAELERRRADFQNAQAKPVPWSELKKER